MTKKALAEWTWLELNDVLMKADQKQCEKLLAEEKAGRSRRLFLLRIHSRINKLRRVAERASLISKL